MIGNHSSSDQNRYSAMRCTLYVMWWTRSANCKCQNVRPGTVSVREKAGSRKERHKGQEDFILLTRKWWRKGEKRNPLPVRVSVSQQTDQRRRKKEQQELLGFGGKWEGGQEEAETTTKNKNAKAEGKTFASLANSQLSHSFSSVCLLCASPCMTQRGSEVRSAERRSVNVGSQKARKREGKELGMLMLPSKQDLRLPWDEEFSLTLSLPLSASSFFISLASLSRESARTCNPRRREAPLLSGLHGIFVSLSESWIRSQVAQASALFPSMTRALQIRHPQTNILRRRYGDNSN